jgi:hypothetical protein
MGHLYAAGTLTDICQYITIILLMKLTEVMQPGNFTLLISVELG